MNGRGGCALRCTTSRAKGKTLPPCPSPACGHSSALSHALLWLQRPNPTHTSYRPAHLWALIRNTRQAHGAALRRLARHNLLRWRVSSSGRLTGAAGKQWQAVG